jgi:aminopeptidase N
MNGSLSNTRRCLAWGAAALLLAIGFSSAASAGGGDLLNDCLVGKLQRSGRALDLEQAIDAESGRNLRHFAPDRVVDLLHMKLDMRFDDLNNMRFTATETLRFSPLGQDTTALTLDAVGLQIDSVHLGQRPVEFYGDDATLTFLFDPPLAVGSEQELVIRYVCDHPTSGMNFTPSSPAAPGYTAEVHTQGETEGNRHWFITHDSPNEKLTTELIVDVPSPFAVSGNGRLVSNEDAGDRSTWHWLQDKPHSSYLVSLVIGRFDIVDIPYEHVPLKVWVPLGMADLVMQSYGRTGQMIDTLERRFGIAYPWDRYDQILLKNFGAGGMENTSVTSMYGTAIYDKAALLDGDLDGLIAHELAHQWTGDLLTCKSWEHIWLNEGWATFGAALWFEQRDGQDGYLDEIRSNFRVARRDVTTNDLPMVSPIYSNSWEVFSRAANPYPKGASILHMLRMMLGEDVFWNGVHLYMNRHAMDVVETHDLRYALEEVSGRGLDWFFDQWCYRPGTPELAVAVRYDAATQQLSLQIDQQQEISARTPAFRFTLPIHVISSSGEQEFRVDVDQRSTSFQAQLDGIPDVIAVDPELAVLKTITVDKSLRLWINQALRGPTIVARRDAIEALGATDSPRTVQLLASVITDESLRPTIRESAVKALRGYSSHEARGVLRDLILAGVGEARLRDDLARAAADLDAKDVAGRLSELAANDPSSRTRVAAINSLAALEQSDQADLLVSLTRYPSQGEQVRRAALSALKELDDPRALDLAIQYAAYGNTDRARSAAVRLIGEVAEQDMDRAVEVLLGLLDDPESRTRRSAVSALARTGDERGIAPLEAIAESARDEAFKTRAAQQLEALKKRIAKAAEHDDSGGEGD